MSYLDFLYSITDDDQYATEGLLDGVKSMRDKRAKKDQLAALNIVVSDFDDIIKSTNVTVNYIIKYLDNVEKIIKNRAEDKNATALVTAIKTMSKYWGSYIKKMRKFNYVAYKLYKGPSIKNIEAENPDPVAFVESRWKKLAPIAHKLIDRISAFSAKYCKRGLEIPGDDVRFLSDSDAITRFILELKLEYEPKDLIIYSRITDSMDDIMLILYMILELNDILDISINGIE